MTRTTRTIGTTRTARPTRTTYEIHIRGQLPQGRLPEPLATQLASAKALATPHETVLLTPLMDQSGLHRMLARLRDFGIELLEIRQDARAWLRGRGGAWVMPSQLTQTSRTSKTSQTRKTGKHGGDLATYELRVRGQLGPLLLSALPHFAAQPVPQHTLLVTVGDNGRDLIEIMRVLVDTGLDVVSVRASQRPATCWRPAGAPGSDQGSDQESDQESLGAASRRMSHWTLWRFVPVVD